MVDYNALESRLSEVEGLYLQNEGYTFEELFKVVCMSDLGSCGAVESELLQGVTFTGTDVMKTERYYLQTMVLWLSEQGSHVPVMKSMATDSMKYVLRTLKFIKDDSEEEYDRETLEKYIGGRLDELVGSEGESDESDESDEEEWVELGNEEEDSEEEEESEEEDLSDAELNKKIGDYYSSFGTGVINELIKRYTSLFSSGYEITKPSGLLTSEGIVRLSGNTRVVAKNSVDVTVMYNIFLRSMDFVEISSRSLVNIANKLYENYRNGSNNVLYFPNKLIEIAYGRCAPTGENQDSLNTYMKHSDAGNWGGYVEKELRKNVKSLVRRSIIGFVRNTMEETGVDYKDGSIAEGLDSYLRYMFASLSMCILVVDYDERTIDGESAVVNLKIRVCDPKNRLGDRNIITDIIYQGYMGGNGEDPFSYEVRIENDTRVKEYAHEFNHTLTQAMPLFAYKALLALKEQSVELSWDNAIMGMFEDSSILRNGTHGVDLQSNFTHMITAGSRAGKGVMTLNLLASAIASNKTIFYADRKPDMASLFKHLAPNMAVINGGGYSSLYDTYGEWSDSALSMWLRNIPEEAVKVFGGRGGLKKNWSDLGDIFYMRFVKLVVGIILARATVEGVASNPNFGGEEGILFICDEISNFSDSYARLFENAVKLLPPSTYVSDKIALEEKKEKAKGGAVDTSRFEAGYNDSTFYALSYVNSMLRDLMFLRSKTDAGFDPTEVSRLDIVCIGQAMERGVVDTDALAESVSNLRYKTVGRTGFSNRDGYKTLEDGCLVYNIVNFKTADAFFGRNMDGVRKAYLGQDNVQSKAHGRLDDKAKMFAYTPSYTEAMRQSIIKPGNVSGNLAIANSLTYFKPFLILNFSEGEPVKECFDRCEKGGISRDSLIRENPDETGKALNPAVGFENYLNLAGIGDYVGVLNKSGAVLDYVVQNCLHYTGTWMDFVTDLRAEWMFSVEDICIGAGGSEPVVCRPMENPDLAEFVSFHPEYFGLSAPEDFANDMTSYFGDGEGVEGFGEGAEGSEFGDRDLDTPGDIDFFEPFDGAEGRAEGYEAEGFGAEGEDLGKEDTPWDEVKEEGIFGLEDEEENGLDDREKVLKLLEELKALGVNVKVPDLENVGRQTDNVSTFENQFSSIDYTDDITSLSQFSDIITKDIISKFGGYDRITSMKVVGGSIVVNGYYYRSKIKDMYTENIPYDVVKDINSGNISKLFNYSTLYKMKNLTSLVFDSESFVYEYVSNSLGFGNSIAVDKFFDTFPRLQSLKIGRETFTRTDYKEKIKGNDLFYKPRVTTRIADVTENFLTSSRKWSWSRAKGTFTNKNYGLLHRAFSGTAYTAVAATTGVAGAASKLTRKTLKKGASILKKGIKNLLDS